MTQIRHPEWRAENDASSYPFGDASLLTNAQGDFFPEGCFLDAQFYPIGGQAGLYIAQVIITHETCTIVLGDSVNESIATGSFSLLDLPDNVTFTDSVGRAAGLIVSEALRLSVFQSWSVGTHVFQPSQTELAATCYIPMPSIGLVGFVLEDGSVFTGDVWIIGDDGVVVRSEESVVIGEDGLELTLPTIRVDVVGDPLFRRRLCSEPVFFQTPRFIQTVTARHNCVNTMLVPDDDGNLSITVGSNEAEDTILRIRPESGRLIIEAVGEPLRNS